MCLCFFFSFEKNLDSDLNYDKILIEYYKNELKFENPLITEELEETKTKNEDKSYEITKIDDTLKLNTNDDEKVTNSPREEVKLERNIDMNEEQNNETNQQSLIDQVIVELKIKANRLQEDYADLFHVSEVAFFLFYFGEVSKIRFFY